MTYAPGETSKTVTVQVLGDVRDEATESFVVNLTNASNASIGDSQGSVSITDNDPTPTIAINDVTSTEGALNTTKTFLFTVSISAASGQTVTMNYATANGTATAGATGDYLSTSGTLTFNPGETLEDHFRDRPR